MENYDSYMKQVAKRYVIYISTRIPGMIDKQEVAIYDDVEVGVKAFLDGKIMRKYCKKVYKALNGQINMQEYFLTLHDPFTGEEMMIGLASYWKSFYFNSWYPFVEPHLIDPDS